MADRTCDRCGASGETALDLGCFSYLCQDCWGDGRHTCGQCEDILACCDCQGDGCSRCAMVGVVA